MNQRNGRVVNAAPAELRAELAARFDGRLVNPAILQVVRIDPEKRHAPRLIALLLDENGNHVVRRERDGALPNLFALAHQGPVKPGFRV